ncbi:MAG TPA: fibronectin type III-like domain-contianing protein, partial [Thermomicrobiales bacterium]|nr:fibronectin type III-like domain-contianing protein [Thermomicrobiales bacterium]
YRHYTSAQVAPLFPFGYGLGYTSFAYGKPALSATTISSGEKLTISMPVTNTGKVTGADVVQLYVHDPISTLQRPVRELRGFARVEVAPGETAIATIDLNMRAFAYFDDSRYCWVAEAGEYELQIGASSEDIRQSVRITLTEDWIEAATDAWLSDQV